MRSHIISPLEFVEFRHVYSGHTMPPWYDQRALALDSEILFLAEPTSGLDPPSYAFDRLLLTLAASLKLTVMMITHDLSTLHTSMMGRERARR